MTQENAQLTSLSVLDVVLLGRLGTLNIRVQDSDITKALSIIRLLHLGSILNVRIMRFIRWAEADCGRGSNLGARSSGADYG